MPINTRLFVAATALAGFAAVPASAQDTVAPSYGFQPGSPEVTLSTAQAGAHPDMTVRFEIARDANDVPVGSTRDVTVDLPVGLVGNPTNAATCSMDDVAASEQEAGFGRCPRESAVGQADATVTYARVGSFGQNFRRRIYRVPTNPGEAAAFGTVVLATPVRMVATVRSDGNYALRVQGVRVPEPEVLRNFRAIFWGVPADHQGGGDGATGEGNGFGFEADGEPIIYPSGDPRASFGLPLEGAERRPFLTNPAVCDGKPLTTSLALTSWADPGTTVGPVGVQTDAITGCDQQRFEPTMAVAPADRRAGQPSGYAVNIDVPQTNSADERSTPPLKDAVVTMPAGTAISPPSADGLDACSDAQLGRGSDEPEACPNASKIGTVRIDTPLLDDPLDGSLYLGTQLSNDPQSGDMYRLFLTADGPGVRIKLRGAIKADPKTGQLTASFLDNPQLPFSRLALEFKGGDRAPLVNPDTCGTKTASGTLSSWGGQSQDVSSSFEIDQACPQGTFNPGFTAGTLNPMAGAFSPFTMTVARNDGDQNLSQIHLDLPAGLLGALGSVPVCAEAQATAGTCAPSTRLGSTTVSVGSGGKPYSLGGTVSLAGPYKGAPFSLSIAVPAKAGPLDLGMVVVRSPLVIDANKGKVFAPADDLPQIVGGVPLRFRTVNITLDRPNFMWNATSCRPQAIGAAFKSVAGAGATPSVPYQAQGCDKLLLNPSLKMTYGTKSELQKGKHPSLTAELSQSFRQAGLKRVAVTLPLTSSLDAKNAGALCMPEQFAARACPAESIVGRASARTPALHEELTGPVYFLKGQRRTADGGVADTLPKLWLKLEGEGVPLDLIADSTIKGRNLVATFESIPDAPISSFKLQIDGGKNGILGAPRDPCTSDRVATAQFDGQNGGRRTRNVTIAAPDCGVRATATASSSRVQLRVVNIGAGKVKVSGKGVKTRTRTLKSGKAATLTAALTSKTRQQVAAGKTVKLRLKVSWTPKGSKKAKTATQTVTIKGAASRAKARTAR